MAGYKNRVITRHFPDLSEEGDDVHVVMRNPRTVPPGELQASAGITDEEAARIAEAGETGDPGSAAENVNRGFVLLSKLIIGWHVYDGTVAGDDQPLLPLPATPDLVAKLPQDILMDLMDQVSMANPRKRLELQEAGTSRTS